MLNKLRGLLAERHITQEALAREIGMTKGTMSRKMRGESKFSWDEVVKIIRSLNLLNDEDELRRIFFAPSDYECNQEESDGMER